MQPAVFARGAAKGLPEWRTEARKMMSSETMSE
jgi:hypothetical protein